MRKRKSDRKNQFVEVNGEIQSIKNQIYGGVYALEDVAVNEIDLSLRKLEELHIELQALQTEKCECLKQVHEHLNYLYSGGSVLGLDFQQTVSKIHPSLGEPEGSKDICNGVRFSIRAVNGSAVDNSALNKETQDGSSENWKVEMLYDGECLLCMKEVNMLRERNEGYKTIKFMDISLDDYTPEDNQCLDYETSWLTLCDFSPNPSDGTNPCNSIKWDYCERC